MSILKELTKDFQYEDSITNPEVRKLTSGPFRGVWVNRNGFCYSKKIGKTLKISRGYYKSSDGHEVSIKPWRLTALVWHDQTPSLHLDNYDRDKYLNLLAFIKVLEKYPDEYELLMNGLKTNHYPLSRGMIFNIVTGCLRRSYSNFNKIHPIEYDRIRWDYLEELSNEIISDFYNFKDELSKELEENLKSEPSTEISVPAEEEPEEDLELCLSDSKLGGAPSMQPKSDTYSFKDIPGYNPDLPMEAQDSCVMDEIELRFGAEIQTKQKEEEKVKEEPQEVQADTKVSSSSPIDELQELFDRRAQLKKELAEIEEKIKASIFH